MWNVERLVGEVLSSQRGVVQMCHVALETQEKGVWVDCIGTWSKQFSLKPMSLARLFLLQNRHVLFECCCDAEENEWMFVN